MIWESLETDNQDGGGGGILQVSLGDLGVVVNVLYSPCPYLVSGPRVGGGHLGGSVEERQLVGLEYK